MLLDVDSALRKMAALVLPVEETEEVELAGAVNRTLAADVIAPIDLPPFDASAMDGYAIDATDLDHLEPKRFEVVGRSAAGHPAAATVRRGEAVRIFTGAVLPKGANAVVLQEDVVRSGDFAETSEPAHIGDHVRPRGQDVRRGAMLFRRGRQLSVYDLSWLAACGIANVRVTRRIRVALLSTGDELAEAGRPLAVGQIYDSNRFSVSSLLRQKAVETIDFGCLPDDPRAIEQTLADAAERADLIVASGGVSVGDADFVKGAVEKQGAIDFWRIALKPGKPLAVGAIGDALFFGLPGNPVSTLVTYLLFVAPAVDLLAGGALTSPLALPATLGHGFKHSVGRREYARGVVDWGVSASAGDDAAAEAREQRPIVHLTGDQGSNRLSTFANANCLVVIDENVGNLQAGDPVSFVPLALEGAHALRHRRDVEAN